MEGILASMIFAHVENRCEVKFLFCLGWTLSWGRAENDAGLNYATLSSKFSIVLWTAEILQAICIPSAYVNVVLSFQYLIVCSIAQSRLISPWHQFHPSTQSPAWKRLRASFGSSLLSGRFFCVAPRDFSFSPASELAAFAVLGGCYVPLAQWNKRNSLGSISLLHLCSCPFKGNFLIESSIAAFLEADLMVCTDYSDQVIAPIG